MLFSVVIPTYNRAAFLPQAIQSVLDQQEQDFELLVIDDGSKDNTRQIVEDFAKQFPEKVKYIHQENRERGAARNLGIRSALGLYVTILDSDDWLLPNHLSTLKEYTRRFPEQNFFTTYYNYSIQGKILPSSVSWLKEGRYDYSSFLKGNNIGCMVCMKRSNPALKLNSERRELSAMEDWIFILENLRYDTIFVIATTTLTVCEHDNRSMNQNKQIIERRLLAAGYVKEVISLTETEKSILDGSSYYFCAIHSYLEGDYRQARLFLRQAKSYSGLTREIFILYWKTRLGRKVTGLFSPLFK